MRALVREALNVAEREVGVRETGKNRGARVNAYLASVGLPPGNPWCAAFTHYCVETAARYVKARNPLPRTGYCPYVAKWAEEQGCLHEEPEAGDLFLLFGKTRPGTFRAYHTGFVTKVDGDDYGTIEGNTNLAGSAEGIGVFRRIRSLSPACKFVRWAEKADDDGTRVFALWLNGQKTEVPLLVQGSTAWIGVRAFGSLLGRSVIWDGDAQAVRWDGELLPVETAVENGVARAAIRELVDALGGRVAWDADQGRVSVTVKP